MQQQHVPTSFLDPRSLPLLLTTHLAPTTCVLRRPLRTEEIGRSPPPCVCMCVSPIGGGGSSNRRKTTKHANPVVERPARWQGTRKPKHESIARWQHQQQKEK